MTTAQQIAQLPFYQACKDADQLAIRIKIIDNDTIWKFADGSQLTSFTDENRVEVL